MPLSFVEQMDKYGYQDWLNEVKEYIEQERIEVTGCGAYHPLLTELNETDSLEQIILNEYGLGYYFGSHKGFEGENAIMIKNVKGFFPPELAVDSSLIDKIHDLGYEWTIVERYTIGGTMAESYEHDPIFKLKDKDLYLVVRDRELSNIISFKNDSSTQNIFDEFRKKSEVASDIVLAMDAETYGHHNREGVSLFESIIQFLNDNSFTTSTISKMLEENYPKEVDEIVKSSWSFHDEVHKTPIDLWKKEGNKIHKVLWELLNAFSKEFKGYEVYSDIEGKETIPVWKEGTLDSLSEEQKKQITIKLLLLKAQNSDQFWWASKDKVGQKILFDRTLVEKNFENYDKILQLEPREKLSKLLEIAREKVKKEFSYDIGQ
jgi:predicted glycosyl hydrolase (DUF1957 family)